MIKTRALELDVYENPANVLNGSRSDHLFFRRFSVLQFQKLVQSGIFAPDDHCELIHGWIIQHMPPNPPHSKSTKRLNRRMSKLFPESKWVLGIQEPIELSDSQPLPDVSVAYGPDDRYDDHHPRPGDLVLVIEVADTTLGFDSSTKMTMYAKAKVSQYWIVNVADRIVLVCKKPVGGSRPRFQEITEYRDSMEIPIVIAGQMHGRVRVSEILP